MFKKKVLLSIVCLSLLIGIGAIIYGGVSLCTQDINETKLVTEDISLAAEAMPMLANESATLRVSTVDFGIEEFSIDETEVPEEEEEIYEGEDYEIHEYVDEEVFVTPLSGINIRFYPDLDAEVYTKAKVGEKLHRVEIGTAGWDLIEIDGEYYYAYSEYLSLDENDVEEPVYSSSNGNGSYYGTCRLTAYCNCSICCGQWANGLTASGTVPEQGRTIACNFLPFGTRVIINGNTYVVEDTGSLAANTIDIYFYSHSEAYVFGVQYADVYLAY